MNIDDYRYITTIAELGSFTHAAQTLFMAQPSLSQRVKYIEKVYGICIFTRDTKGVKLTDEGECFVRHAQQILDKEAALHHEIMEMHNPENKILRIGATQFIRSYLFNLLIHHLHQDHPQMQFSFYEATSLDLQEALLAGKTDIAICYLPVTSPQLDYEVIFHDSYVLIPAHQSSLQRKIENRTNKNEPVSMELLKDVPFAMASPGTRLHDYVAKIQQKHDIQLDIQHYVKNYSMLYTLAKAGIASTILYESFFDPTEDKYLPYYYLEDDCDLSIALVWRKDTYLRSSVREFIRIAKKICSSSL